MTGADGHLGHPIQTAPIEITMGRIATVVRATATLTAVGCGIAGAGPPADWRWLVPSLLLLVGWTLLYCAVAWRRGVLWWIALGDLGLAAGFCLAMGQLVATEALPRGTGWVAILASTIVIFAQTASVPVVTVPGGLVVAACFVLGSTWAAVDDDGIPQAVTLVLQIAAGAAVTVIVTRAGRAAAVAYHDLHVATLDEQIADARRADERARLRRLHNGPLTTLTMAVHAEGHPDALLRRRAAASLDALPEQLAQHQPDVPAAEPLDERLAQVLIWNEPFLRVSTRLERCVVPSPVAHAFGEALSECLENVVRHAGTPNVAVDLVESGGSVRVEVADDGCGFDPEAVPAHRFGLRESVRGQLAAVGGAATVSSARGRGTRISLEWHPSGQTVDAVDRPSAPAPVQEVRRRYDNGGLWAAIVVMLGWHAFSALPTTLSTAGRLQPPAIGLGVWLAYAVVGILTTVVVLGGREQGIALTALILPILLAGVFLLAVRSDGGTCLDPASWGFASAGWFALVALWRRPLPELLVVLATISAVAFASLVLADALDRISLARFAIVSYGIASLQVAVLVGSRALTAEAGNTAQVHETRDSMTRRRIVAEALHEARQARAGSVQQAAAQLLTVIARGAVDLSEAATQQQLRVAVSRLRRLTVETEDVPDPLQRELRAWADAAERRGVEVDLQAPSGVVPHVPATTRRALTDPVIEVLAVAQRHARITVVASPAAVTVGITADAPTDRLHTVLQESAARNVSISWEPMGEMAVWTQTRWTDE
ncbi:sensor histidine kinase [Cryptosporangium sp. NPDC051539]|uniref:sensor histidine kinase n=1 Tax=Cryptosporangium sp. NPDC051539 TaxID=3363962 RepID=UPI003798EAF5